MIWEKMNIFMKAVTKQFSTHRHKLSAEQQNFTDSGEREIFLYE